MAHKVAASNVSEMRNAIIIGYEHNALAPFMF